MAAYYAEEGAVGVLEKELLSYRIDFGVGLQLVRTLVEGCSPYYDDHNTGEDNCGVADSKGGSQVEEHVDSK
jgi:hypothetical protein